jgi:flagellar basal-body rod protein FlgB
MDATSAIMTIKALDGLAVRATVTAENIANANTRGYRPLRVRFEDALKSASAGGEQTIAEVSPEIDHAPINSLPAGDQLRLDLEMETASTTALRYNALISVLGREMQLDSLAITGNG